MRKNTRTHHVILTKEKKIG